MCDGKNFACNYIHVFAAPAFVREQRATGGLYFKIVLRPTNVCLGACFWYLCVCVMVVRSILCAGFQIVCCYIWCGGVCAKLRVYLRLCALRCNHRSHGSILYCGRHLLHRLWRGEHVVAYYYYTSGTNARARCAQGNRI